jgi:hypothetical protein
MMRRGNKRPGATNSIVMTGHERSIEPRFGKRKVPLPLAEENEMIIKAWTIMNRFLEYKKRGDRPLPISDFPLLI